MNHAALAWPVGSSRFAMLAPLWFVSEAFVGEKHLLASSEDKLRTAISAFQDLIVVFHWESPMGTPSLRIVCP
jgi:hypothetical protein